MPESEYLKCPLCGFTFHITQGKCSAQCPLSDSCKLLVCPNCGYSASEADFSSSGSTWLSARKLLDIFLKKKRRRKKDDSCPERPEGK